MTTSAFPVRDATFPFAAVPRYWHGGRRAVTIFFNNLSTLFPLGERFFIRSVARYRKQLDNDKLRAEVRAFTRQEASHTREHEAYNEMLRGHGYDVDNLERGIAALLRLPTLAGPLRDRVCLAATCGLEHWTGLLGHFVLADESVLADADPTMAALWRWHAAEECEHKSVAFDVYRQTGGGYVVRTAIMLLASGLFWARVLQQQWKLMRTDGIHLNVREWLDLARFLVVEQKIILRLLPLWLSYFRPRFHPEDVDDHALITNWQTEHAPDLTYRERATA